MNESRPRFRCLAPEEGAALDLFRSEAESHPDWADVQNRQGLQLLAEGRTEEAEEVFRHCLDLNPRYAWARLNLAGALAVLGRFADARRTADPSQEPAPGARGLTEGWIGLLEGHPERTRTVLSRLPRRLAERVDVVRLRMLAGGEGPLPSDTVDAAWADEDRPGWLREPGAGDTPLLLPGLYQFWLELSRMSARLEDFAGARRCARIAYAHWSDRGPFLNQLGFLASLEGNETGAASYYQEATEVAPEDPEGPIALSYHWAGAGKVDLAIRYLALALERAPGYADLHRQMALLERSRGNHETAVACLRRALEINPLYATARLDLAQEFFDLGRWREAAECYEQARAAGLSSADLHLHHGRSLENLGRLDEAESEYRRAVELNPSEALAHYRLGMIRRERDDREGAKTHWRRFLEVTRDPERRAEIEALLEGEGFIARSSAGEEEETL